MSRCHFAVAPGPVAPGAFIRPDGSIEVTPANLGEPEHVDAIRQHIDRLREVTPLKWDHPKHKGSEL